MKNGKKEKNWKAKIEINSRDKEKKKKTESQRIVCLSGYPCMYGEHNNTETYPFEEGGQERFTLLLLVCGTELKKSRETKIHTQKKYKKSLREVAEK